MADPLIVTAELPPDLFRWANALRQAHFPPERNHLQAHVTLFHALAPSLYDEVCGLLGQLAADHAAPVGRVRGIMNLGRGTAIALDSPDLLALRERIAIRFHGALSAQDSHRPRLHITVQNKVLPEAARQLQADLAGDGIIRGAENGEFRFPGLALHHYRGGPWDAAGRWSFRGRQNPQSGG